MIFLRQKVKIFPRILFNLKIYKNNSLEVNIHKLQSEGHIKNRS